MDTSQHMIFAKPDVWCSNTSPGGGTYGVSSSNDFARAIRASLAGSGSCDAAVLAARVTTTGTSKSLIVTTSCDRDHASSVVRLAVGWFRRRLRHWPWSARKHRSRSGTCSALAHVGGLAAD